MSWEDVEDAMHAAVVKASRFPAAQVAWSYQNVNEPSQPHIVISFGGAQAIGVDRVRTSQDLNRVTGQEIKQEVRGLREAPFELQCFTNEVSGSSAARWILELTRTRFRLDDVRHPLSKVGVSPFDTTGQISWVPDIASVGFRGRATCTIRCYVPMLDCEEFVGYISRIRGTFYPTGFVNSGYGASGFAFDSSG